MAFEDREDLLPEVLPVREYGVLPGKERNPVPRLDQMIGGDGPMIYHHQLHMIGLYLETMNELTQRDGLIQVVEDRGGDGFPRFSSQ